MLGFDGGHPQPRPHHYASLVAASFGDDNKRQRPQSHVLSPLRFSAEQRSAADSFNGDDLQGSSSSCIVDDVTSFDSLSDQGHSRGSYGHSFSWKVFWPWRLISGWGLFTSPLERMARDPRWKGGVDCSYHPPEVLTRLMIRSVLFFFTYMFIRNYRPSICTSDLLNEAGEISLGSATPASVTNETPQSENILTTFSEVMVTTCIAYTFSTGYFMLRNTRERMERLGQDCVTLAYALIKTTSTDSPVGYSPDELQVVVYECLALLTAYPVALKEQFRGNTCEPAITKYCYEAARMLKRLRDGRGVPFHRHCPGRLGPGQHDENHCFRVDYFFEKFSLEIQLEYAKKEMRTSLKSLNPQQIIVKIRDHFENLSDLGNMDDHRMPIMRENIDQLSMLGRELGVFCYRDTAPVLFLWTCDLCGRFLVVTAPFRRCQWVINAADTLETSFIAQLLGWASIAAASLVCAILYSIVEDAWNMWDPWNKMSVQFWVLGLAREYDSMLNEFDEVEPLYLSRRHNYMNGPVHRPHSASSSRKGFSHPEPISSAQTA